MTPADGPPGQFPGYSPCGAIVGVVRSAYKRACRWYPGGPVGLIEYYFVPPTNKVLPGSHVIFPYSQFEPEIVNTDGVGEITTQRRFYSKGNNPTPLNDGSRPCGNAQDFQGITPVPLTPAVPCACDTPPGFGLWLRMRGAMQPYFGTPGVLPMNVAIRGTIIEPTHNVLVADGGAAGDGSAATGNRFLLMTGGGSGDGSQPGGSVLKADGGGSGDGEAGH